MKAHITYELFGAKGDGVKNDIDAIIAAHSYANAHGLDDKDEEDLLRYLQAFYPQD